MKNLSFVTVIFILVCLSCNPAKRVLDRNNDFNKVMGEYIKNHPFRVDTVTKFLPGLDSSIFFKKEADSLRQIASRTLYSIETIYKDTCKSASSRYIEGFNIGYQIGSTGSIHYIHDTLRISFLETEKMEELKRELQVAKDEVNKNHLGWIKEKRWFWISISMGLLLLIFIILFVAKKLIL